MVTDVMAPTISNVYYNCVAGVVPLEFWLLLIFVDGRCYAKVTYGTTTNCKR